MEPDEIAYLWYTAIVGTAIWAYLVTIGVLHV